MTTNRSEPEIGGAYTLLGVVPGATPEEIKRAYRRLAFDLHPDRHPEANAAERQALAGRFAAVASAYDQIKDGKAPPPPYAPHAKAPPPGTNDRYAPYAVCGACGHAGWCHAIGPCVACAILGTRCQGAWTAPGPTPKPKTCHTDGRCLRCRASVTRGNDLCDCPCHPRRQHRPPQPAPSAKIPWYRLSLSRGGERLGNTKQFRQALRGLRQHCGRGRRAISAVELIYGPRSRTGTWYDHGRPIGLESLPVDRDDREPRDSGGSQRKARGLARLPPGPRAEGLAGAGPHATEETKMLTHEAMRCCAWHDLHPTDSGACRRASMTEAGVRWYNAAGDELCRCGQPLHYFRTAGRDTIETLIAAVGRLDVQVKTATGTYEVSRHYIALHGLRADELPDLARRGIVTALDEKPKEESA